MKQSYKKQRSNRSAMPFPLTFVSLLTVLPVVALALAVLTREAAARSPRDALCPAQLGTTLEAIATEALGEQARWGALVEPAAAGSSGLDPIYARQAQQYFTPASNVKLFTAAAALVALGPDFRIRTSVYAVPAGRDAVDLWVVGRGDPSIDYGDLRQLARQVAEAGVSQVRRLAGDQRYLGDRFVNPTWDWEDVQAGYGAPVSSLILDQNAIGVRLFPQRVGQPLRLEWEQPQLAQQWRVVNESVTVAASEPEFIRVGRDWSAPVLRVRGQLRVGAALDRSAVAVTEPAAHFLRQFEAALAATGISVRQISPGGLPYFDQALPAPGQAIATVVSPPLRQLLVDINAHSRNLYAEALLRHLGRDVAAGTTGAALLAAGLAQVDATLAPLGVTAAYQLADGSGLSRRSLVTPLALVQTLQAMAQHPYAPVYRASLAVAGERGTLQSRFQGSAVAGRFQGKSGGLTGVSSLSGYLQPPDYPPLVVSLLIDHSDRSGAVRRQTLDAMVAAIARLTPCPGSD